MLKIGFICPTYDALNFDSYTKLSLESFFTTTPNGVALVVDDGSSGWSDNYVKSLKDCVNRYPGCDLHVIHFPKNGGLTRSWNAGLTKADELNLDYAIAGNNDVVFTDKCLVKFTSAVALIDNKFSCADVCPLAASIKGFLLSYNKAPLLLVAWTDPKRPSLA